MIRHYIISSEEYYLQKTDGISPGLALSQGRDQPRSTTSSQLFSGSNGEEYSGDKLPDLLFIRAVNLTDLEHSTHCHIHASTLAAAPPPKIPRQIIVSYVP